MYNAILKWSLTQSDGFTSDETTEGKTTEPMSEERKAFLRKAMDTYIVNETQRINDIVEILKFEPGKQADVAKGGSTSEKGDTVENYSDVIKAAVDIKVSGGTPDIQAMLAAVPASAVTEMKLEALTELEERVEQVDNATFFACGCNGNGELELILALIRKHPSSQVRAAAGSVLATVLQNNEESQSRASKIPGFVASLVSIVRDPTSDHAVQTKAFGVVTSYVRGSNPAARVAEFLSPQVQGPELISAILASTQARGVWQRYTPSFASTPRKGWWRQVPQGEAVERGSEISLDFANGINWVKYSGEGDPSKEGSNVNERLVKKAIFFLQFLLREIAKGRASNPAEVLQRLNLVGPAGEALVEFAGNVEQDAVEVSEGSARVLLQFLQLPDTATGAATAGASTSTAIVSVKQDDENDTTQQGEKDVGGAAPVPKVTLKALFRKRFASTLASACEAQRKALTGLEYVEEPLELFKSLSIAAVE